MISSDHQKVIQLLERQIAFEQGGIEASESRVADARQDILREEKFQNQSRVFIRALNDAISNLKAQGSEAGNGNA